MTDVGLPASLTSDSLADPVVQMMNDAMKFKILVEVLELKLFDEIDKQGNALEISSFAYKQGYDVDMLERLLNTLACFHLINKIEHNGKCFYENTDITRKYLISSRRPSLIPCIMSTNKMVLPMFNKLAATLKKASNNNKSDVSESLEKMNLQNSYPDIFMDNTKPGETKRDKNQNPVIVPNHGSTTGPPSPMMFMASMDGMMASAAKALATAFDFSAHKTILDLGGSSGYLAHEFAKTYSNVRAVVFDLPDIVKIAKSQQPEDMKSRVSFVAGDFFQHQLPSADLMVIAHVLHNWEEGKVKLLLRKVYNSLPPGGSILIAEKVFLDDKTGPESSVLLDISMALMCKGRERTQREYHDLLSQEGFRNMRVKRIHGINHYDAILALKPF